MKKIFSLLLITICNPLFINALEDNDWSTNNIPAELKIKANAILRNYSKEVSVFANGEVIESVNIATTILNENGESNCYFVESYDKYSSISNIEGFVYDKNGKRLKKIKSDEFIDISAIAGFSIYDDNRLKVANPKIGDFPYTVVYSFKKKA